MRSVRAREGKHNSTSEDTTHAGCMASLQFAVIGLSIFNSVYLCIDIGKSLQVYKCLLVYVLLVNNKLHSYANILSKH